MILKHRDRELLRFEWIDPQGVRVLSVNEAERKFLPLEMKGVAIEDFLQSRISKIMDFGKDADKFLAISTNNDSVNHVSKESSALQIKENIKADPFITYAELAEILQISQSSIARKIKELQDTGEIKRMGADKNGYWLVVSA